MSTYLGARTGATSGTDAVAPLASEIDLRIPTTAGVFSVCRALQEDAGVDSETGLEISPDIFLTVGDCHTLAPTLFGSGLATTTQATTPQSGCLNDNIIDSFFRVRVARELKRARYYWEEMSDYAPPRPVHSFSSAWYETAENPDANFNRWTHRFNLSNGRLLRAETILLPFCLEKHWRLLVLKPQEKQIRYLDSMGYPFTDEIRDRLRNLLRSVLGEAGVRDWLIDPCVKSVHQKNAEDCGVFVCLNGLISLDGKISHDAVEPIVNDTKEARLYILNQLLEACE